MGYHSVKFGGQRRSGRGNIMGFVCRMILKDHMIKRLNDFMVRSSSRYVTILPSLVAIDPVVVEM